MCVRVRMCESTHVCVSQMHTGQGTACDIYRPRTWHTELTRLLITNVTSNMPILAQISYIQTHTHAQTFSAIPKQNHVAIHTQPSSTRIPQHFLCETPRITGSSFSSAPLPYRSHLYLKLQIYLLLSLFPSFSSFKARLITLGVWTQAQAQKH